LAEHSIAAAITHPEKVLFPADGITKGDLCAYYEAVAPLMLPHIAGRPITMERYPAGIGKKGFLQKDVVKGFPSWLERVEVERREPKKSERESESGGESGSVHYPLARDARALLWLANQNCVTPHVWISRAPNLKEPDLCVFDLDPPGDEPEAVREAALAVRALLNELGVPSFIKTSGSKGFHIVVPLSGASEATQIWRFAHGVGAVLVKRHPALLTQEFIKADRGGRIFVDTGRNAPGATFAAVYAVRAKAGAPVSAPCTWDEVACGAIEPRTFTLRNMPGRLEVTGDLWADLESHGCSLHKALAAVEGLLTDEDWREAQAASIRRPKSRKG